MIKTVIDNTFQDGQQSFNASENFNQFFTLTIIISSITNFLFFFKRTWSFYEILQMTFWFVRSLSPITHSVLNINLIQN